MSHMLDPWNDASIIAKRLQSAQSRLLVVVGAESWCGRCRDIRPDFDIIASEAINEDTLLWLDIEEHAEFLGGFYPENLPMLFIYKGKYLASCTFLENAAALHSASQFTLINQNDRPADPGIRSRLLLEDWAV